MAGKRTLALTAEVPGVSVRRLLGSLLVLAITACASGPGEADVIASVTDGAIIPNFQQAAEDGATLSEAMDAFCESPGADSLAAAREAWLMAKLSWERAELGALHGPGAMLQTIAKVDYEPVSEEGIDDLIRSDTSIDFDYVDNHVASTRRGLGTVEYLLFTDPDEAAAERACDLSRAAADVIEAATADVARAWSESYEGGDPYRETFTSDMTTDAGLGEIFASMVEILENQARFEIGRALGDTAPEADPEAIPEGPAGAGADRYVAQLEGVRDELLAGGEDSLIALIAARSKEVSSRIEAHLENAISDLEAIDRPLVTIARDEPERLAQVEAELNELVTLFEADVVSLLDITLGSSDSDGDSG